ncbi:CoA transferase [Lentibacillus sp. N15]|uniref:CaiB/BaiF CoA transferase family protein n=1 Tax=Lentibacillus songyuanensis TaxID=3136161 RepID=UPI0031B9D9DF
MILSNIKVIDASTIMAAPLIATNLGDFGADVIKIEHPQKGDSSRSLSMKKNGIPLMWKWLSRNKRPISLNLKGGFDQEVFIKLVKESDILIENFRPGTLEKWGIGSKKLREINPNLIMVRVTAYGQYGPYANRPGFGTVAEAMSGFAQMTGFPDGPPTLPPFGLGDTIASLNGTYAVMMALYDRDVNKNGGQVIDISIIESMFAALGSQTTDYDAIGKIPKRVGNRVPFSAPRNLYKTRDNKYVCISGSAQTITNRIFKAIGREDLITDPRFVTNDVRLKNVDALDNIIGSWIIERDRDDVIDIFKKEQAAIGPIYDISDIFTDPHFIEREMIKEIEDPELTTVKMQNIVPRLSNNPGKIHFAGKEMGECNEEILKELGYSSEVIKKFIRSRDNA